MTQVQLRRSLASWRNGAPWAEWTRQRSVTVWWLLGGPLVVGALALLAGYSVGWCHLFGNECSPEESRQLAVAAAVYLGSAVFFVTAATVVFALRRRFVWLLPLLLLGWALVSYLIP